MLAECCIGLLTRDMVEYECLEVVFPSHAWEPFDEERGLSMPYATSAYSTNLPPIRQRLELQPLSPEEYAAIRRLWIQHSIAEDKRDLDGLVATLTEQCVYEVVGTTQRWEGHDGARSFYTTFLGAFPDVHFDLTDIVIGPQGVFETALATGTHQGEWAGIAPTGKRVEFIVHILFPWNSIARKFDGERVWADYSALRDQG